MVKYLVSKKVIKWDETGINLLYLAKEQCSTANFKTFRTYDFLGKALINIGFKNVKHSLIFGTKTFVEFLCFKIII